MIVCRLSISYERGCKRNKPQHLGIKKSRPTPVEKSGAELRGLGSHWTSEAAKTHARQCEAEERRLRLAFDGQFARSPLPGIYVVPSADAAESFLEGLGVDPRVDCTLGIYNLAPEGSLPIEELKGWAERLRDQFSKVQLGRKKIADTSGIDSLERLAQCPIIGEETRSKILELCAEARIEKVDRKSLRRQLGSLDFSVDPTASVMPARPMLRMPEPEEQEDPTATVLRRPALGGAR